MAMTQREIEMAQLRAAERRALASQRAYRRITPTGNKRYVVKEVKPGISYMIWEDGAYKKTVLALTCDAALTAYLEGQ